MTKPGGTGRPSTVISARLAPLPPRRSFMSLPPSAKSYTYFVTRLLLSRRGVPRLPAGVPPVTGRSPYDEQQREHASGDGVRPAAAPLPLRLRGRRRLPYEAVHGRPLPLRAGEQGGAVGGVREALPLEGLGERADLGVTLEGARHVVPLHRPLVDVGVGAQRDAAAVRGDVAGGDQPLGEAADARPAHGPGPLELDLGDEGQRVGAVGVELLR